MATTRENTSYSGLEIAVIGMAGRFPGAPDLRTFWENLKNGTESIAFFSEEELKSFGIDEASLQNPHYVKAKGALEQIDYFDAPFFNYTQREARFMDPQLRILSECAWHALEDAAYNPEQYPGAIGLYLGAGLNLPWISQFLLQPHTPAELFDLTNLNDNSSFATALSYKLNLRGPAININTACSTSLVAIHLACKALLSGECHVALAGGVSVSLPAKSGYLYQDGMIFSPDGHCRAFDADARGTVNGDGVGIVVLKPLEDALADRDHIYAVIKESTINNDGKRKVGYTAPSVKGQAEVIRTAQLAAGVESESITYVETHGTGTTLGDPVEIEALKQAFGTPQKGFCAIGSVKSNIGHLDEAAGVAGFIKTVLALQHKLIPPSLHFQKPNPKIDFANSPFYVNTALKEWKSDGYPLRAGVSSFGIGGTNAHVIVEEAPTVIPAETTSNRPWQLLTLSARTPASLDELTKRLAVFLRENPTTQLSDMAYTLHTGRKHFPCRRLVLADTRQAALESLTQPNPDRLNLVHSEDEAPTIVFMFPGQGAQYVQMGRGLYQTEPVFQREVDACLRIVSSHTAHDIKRLLYPTAETREEATDKINQTEITQLVLFVVEYALAQLLMHWGIRPSKMIGHSLGEYVAACLAGVFSLADALKMVALRGQLMQQAQPGAMLSVKLTQEVVTALLTEEVSLAAVNSTSFCVVAGTYQGIDQFEKTLSEKGYESSRLHTSHAFHSPLMDSVVDAFTDGIQAIELHPPTIPYISNVSGTWITIEDATNPRYWAQQIRRPVQFSKGLEDLLEEDKMVLIEVGPGHTLSSFVKRHAKHTPQQEAITLLRHPLETTEDAEYLLNKLGQLWLHQVRIDWQVFHEHEERSRVSLPLYAFDRQSYWPDTMPSGKLSPSKSEQEQNASQADLSNWFYAPVWQSTPRPTMAWGSQEAQHWLVFANDTPWEKNLIQQIKQHSRTVTTVRPGTAFASLGDATYQLHPSNPDDYKALFKELIGQSALPHKVMHMWNVENASDAMTPALNQQAQELGFYSLLHLACAIGEESLSQPMQIHVLSNHLHRVTEEDQIRPEKATLLGPVKVIPQEYPHLTCRNIDIDLVDTQQAMGGEMVQALWEEVNAEAIDILVAYRNHQRFIQTFQPIALQKSSSGVAFREKGVYLLIGGLGGIGFSLAQYLAKTYQAKLILVGRSAFPPRAEWEQILAGQTHEASVRSKIAAIREMEAAGAEVAIERADVTELEAMQAVIQRAIHAFGAIHGVLHCAGLAEGALIQRRTREMSEAVLAPKVKGMGVLETVLSGHEPDFMVLFSSLGNVLFKEKVGQVAYNAANEFFDAYAEYRKGRSRTVTMSINWEDWQQVGMSAKSAQEWDQFLAASASDVDSDDNFKVDIQEPGDVDTLRFTYAKRRKPGPGEVEIKVVAAALNFKDVLYALGLLALPDDTDMRFGQECAGTIVALGEGVTQFAIGDQVVALPGHSAFSSYATLSCADLAHQAPHMRAEEATTIPVAFMTAYYALVSLGRLRKGERVLIHSAAGGVGLAAVHIAQWLGAEIYATAGNEEKRQYLQSLGVQHTMDSRSLNFAAQVRALTADKGVDVVLNSLAGEYLFASIGLLAPYGRFLELGVKDIYANNHLEMRYFERGQSFFSVQLGPDLPEYQSVWQEVMQLFQEKKMSPLPYKVFSVLELKEAFRYMTQAKHIGKIVLSFNEEEDVFKQVVPEGKVVKRPTGKKRVAKVQNTFQQKLQQEGLLPADGIEALCRMIEAGQPRVAVSPSNLSELIQQQSYVTRLLENAGAANAETPSYLVSDTNVEEVVGHTLAEFFGRDALAPDANFFELGATSLDIIQINSRLNQLLKLDTPFVTLYKYQTVAELAAFLRKDASPQQQVPASPTDRSEELKKGKEGAQQRLKLRKNLNNS